LLGTEWHFVYFLYYIIDIYMFYIALFYNIDTLIVTELLVGFFLPQLVLILLKKQQDGPVVKNGLFSISHNQFHYYFSLNWIKMENHK